MVRDSHLQHAGHSARRLSGRRLGARFCRGGAVLIGSAIALVVVLHFTTRLSSIMLFWIAFVLTRPFGATLGDVLTKPYEKGGLDFGTIGSSAVLLAVLLALVVVVV
ncbi:putative Membrane protein, partial [Pseudomonas ficuserectae]